MAVGIDLVRVQDVADSIARWGDRYLRRVFTPGEIAYCGAPGSPAAAERYAARWAAKEAARKALRVGDAGLGWQTVEVCRGVDGAAALCLHGAAAERARAAGLGPFAVSLTHEAGWAAAVVTAVATAAPARPRPLRRSPRPYARPPRP